ncbi:MAG TPA: serine hydrolase domain-containing protein [Kofleriaceae bacterium]|nr:serine hydrolase domain-containing protein [Kofleriaceae bacterium]
MTDLASRLHAALEGHVARGDVPGLVALVAQGDDVVTCVVGALADGGAPVRRDSLFRISSMTKPITAAAAMIAIDDGALALDAPVERWLPELADRRVLRTMASELDDTVAADRSITVRDLLAFTLGLGIPLAPPGTYPIQRAMDAEDLGQHQPSPARCPAPDEWMRRLGKLPLMRQPGAAWMYNTGADVLGVLVARATRTAFPDFLRERLFQPLGMRDTAFSVAPADRHRLATAYAVSPSGGRTVYDPPDGQWSTPPAFPGGAAGLVSTADDFLAFSELLLGRGARRGTRLISAAAVDAMTRDQLTLAQRAASHWVPGFFAHMTWGFGLAVLTAADPSGAPGAFGWDGGLGSVWRADPATGRTTLLLTQQAWASPSPPQVARDFWAAARS